MCAVLDTGSRIGVIFVPTKDDKELAEMHFIVNGDDLGAQAADIPYREIPLYVCVDVYGTTKSVSSLCTTGKGTIIYLSLLSTFR